MRNRLSIVLVASLGLVVMACGGDTSDGPPKGTGGTAGTGGNTLDCSTLQSPPPDCQKSCTSDAQCEASFCDNGVCVAHCTATEGCDATSTCNVRGRCIPNPGTGGTGGTGNAGGGNACQSVSITPSRSIPNVMFLVDQSGSMTEAVCAPAGVGSCPANPPNRWVAAHGAITTIVQDLESIVAFGLTTYHSEGGGAVPEQCPILETQVGIALDNFSAIDQDYASSFPGGSDTPTGESIDAVVAGIQAAELPGDGPTILVLATDGEPDTCAVPNPQTGQPEAVAAAVASHAANIDLFILSVGDDVGEDHLQEMANVGVGLAADGSQGDAPYWVGLNPDELSNAFREIISASISCDIQMAERFDDKELACNDPESDVRLNGMPLSCPQDWIVKPGEDDVIELVGSACDTFKSGDATFSAEFPCGAIVVE